MNHPSKRLGDLLKVTREKKGLILLEVAQATNTTAQYVCDVEHGRKRMTYELIKPWGKVISLDPELILAFILSEKQYDAEKRSGVRVEFKYFPKSQNHSKNAKSQEQSIGAR